MQLGKIPKSWKDAVVKPFYKGGGKQLPGNYRPVSLTSVVCKVMERWVKELVLTWMEQRGMLSDKQHGFMKNRSCVKNLLLSREAWISNVEDRCSTDIIYFDLSKAFDRVDHDALLRQLVRYEIPSPIVTWTANFLQGRYFQVRVNGTLS